MRLLREAVRSGYRDANQYRIEKALDPLRDRSDFQLLIMDLAMPAAASSRRVAEDPAPPIDQSRFICVLRVERRGRINGRLGWLQGQLEEFLGRQALVQPHTSHRHRLEGEQYAVSLPEAQEVSNSL